jgi:transposase
MSESTLNRCYDAEAYKGRNLIERMFCQLKDFRRIATRYDKLARNFLAGVLIAALVQSVCPALPAQNRPIVDFNSF